MRAITPNYNQRDVAYFIANFTEIEAGWFKTEIKKYIHYLCKTGNRLSTVNHHLSALRFLARYLQQIEVADFEQINRSLIQSYLAQLKTINSIT